jgi:DNA uptake protein ComE-like DNA-binding protein
MKRGTRLLRELAVFNVATISCLALLWLAGCSDRPRSDQQIRQQAAQTTGQVRANAQQAAAQAKLAAANAERKVNDIAAGIKEGMHSNASSSHSGPVDINRASEARMSTLPGITAARARRIIHNRPYHATHDLVSKGVLSRAEYDQISGRIVAGND